MILNGGIEREACRICGGPVICLRTDGAVIMRVCLSRATPGNDWFCLGPEDKPLLSPLPGDHEILALMRARHAEASRDE